MLFAIEINCSLVTPANISYPMVMLYQFRAWPAPVMNTKIPSLMGGTLDKEVLPWNASEAKML